MPPKTNIYTVIKVEHEFGLTKVRPKFEKMSELYFSFLLEFSLFALKLFCIYFILSLLRI